MRIPRDWFLLRTLFVCLASGVVIASARAEDPWLEVPEQHVHVNADDSAVLQSANVPTLVLHVGRQPSDVSYARISTRINAEIANIVSTQSAGTDGILCRFDLTRNPELSLKPGRNSVEVVFRDRWNEVHYASFLLQLPGGRGEATRRAATPGPIQSPSNRYALVIGVSKYKFDGRGIRNLPYADSDAARMRDALLSVHGGGVHQENMQVLLNEDATLENIKSALAALRAKTKPTDSVVLYLNLNGAYDPKEPDRKYLMAHDSDPGDMRNTALAVGDLISIASSPVDPARIVLLADTCHQRGIGVEGDESKLPHNFVNLYLAQAFAAAGQAALEASDVQQLSHDGANWGNGGVFTYFLAKGMAGAADANSDAIVTVEELFRYVERHVTDETFDKQVPLGATGKSAGLSVAGVRGPHKPETTPTVTRRPGAKL